MRLGAIFHDALYYLLKPGYDPTIRELGDKLHGANGEDTFAIIRNVLKSIDESALGEQVLAFLVGAVTHIFTDIAFHPMVYFLTGNVYATDDAKRRQAVPRHRRLETLMDVYFCGGLKHVSQYSISSYLKAMEAERDALFWEMAKGFFPADRRAEVVRSFASAYQAFALVQSLSIHKTFARVFSTLEALPVLPRSGREIAALLYAPGLLRHLEKISGPISYRNPLSGDEHLVTLDTLFEQAVETSVEFSRTVEKILKKEASVDALPAGPCLELAIPGAVATRMRFFSPEEFFA